MNDQKQLMNIFAQAYQLIAKASKQQPSQEGFQQILEMLGEEGIKECAKVADQGPEAVAQAIVQIIQQKSAQKAANGAKLKYIMHLQGKCQPGYLKKGGRCKPCEMEAGVFRNKADFFEDGGEMMNRLFNSIKLPNITVTAPVTYPNRLYVNTNTNPWHPDYGKTTRYILRDRPGYRYSHAPESIKDVSDWRDLVAYSTIDRNGNTKFFTGPEQETDYATWMKLLKTTTPESRASIGKKNKKPKKQVGGIINSKDFNEKASRYLTKENPGLFDNRPSQTGYLVPVSKQSIGDRNPISDILTNESSSIRHELDHNILNNQIINKRLDEKLKQYKSDSPTIQPSRTGYLVPYDPNNVKDYDALFKRPSTQNDIQNTRERILNPKDYQKLNNKRKDELYSPINKEEKGGSMGKYRRHPYLGNREIYPIGGGKYMYYDRIYNNPDDLAEDNVRGDRAITGRNIYMYPNKHNWRVTESDTTYIPGSNKEKFEKFLKGVSPEDRKKMQRTK